ncbi:MAG TPA: methyltransferase domain-containing protein, partial [Planctomycetaceae bacterium]|nr:methyltransferase domain-containing protein [Planctomycetaceae bacterium]
AATGADRPPGPRDRAKQILEDSGVSGGLVVHLGCGDGRLTTALAAEDRYLVHALDSDPACVAKTRQRIRALGLTGRVSADLWSGGALPYIDSLVNLFVSEDGEAVPVAEIRRVLVPGGVAYLRQEGRWTKIVKPRSEAIDEWTHCYYDATNNAVSDDQLVAPPYHLQWKAGPRHTRSHEHASVSVVVSASGRLFSIVDEGPAASVILPSRWVPIARDAFNGVVLWKRPIPQWDAHPAGLYRGPPEIARRLVAVGDRVYVTLGTGAAVTALDAATGRTKLTYSGTEGTGEILYERGRLYLVAAGPVARRGRVSEPVVPQGSAITVLDAHSGELVWTKPDAQALSGTLAVHGDRVFYVAPQAVVCLDAKTGRPVWRTQYPTPKKRFVWRAPTLVVSDDVVLCADRRPTPPSNIDEATGRRLPQWLANAGAPCDLTAYSAKTGKKLWSALAAESYYAPPDVFVHNGLVWIGQTRARQGPDYTVARDLKTGKIKHRIQPDKAFQTTMPHHRCHRDRATARYLVTGRTGIEFIDFRTGEAFRHHWVRGVCRYGVLPSNGLVYAPPHSCAYFIEAKLTGFNALAPASPTRKLPTVIPEQGRLRRGSASVPTAGATPLDPPSSLDWPTYRHDAARTGATKSQVPARLMRLWQRELGGRLSPPVIAQGQLIVTAIDTHTVHAFDALTGRARWQFTAGGRIDSPPTL